jgi:hypothetical protein
MHASVRLRKASGIATGKLGVAGLIFKKDARHARKLRVKNFPAVAQKCARRLTLIGAAPRCEGQAPMQSVVFRRLSNPQLLSPKLTFTPLLTEMETW